MVTSLTAVHAYGLKFTDTQILNIDSDHGLKKKKKENTQKQQEHKMKEHFCPWRKKCPLRLLLLVIIT